VAREVLWLGRVEQNRSEHLLGWRLVVVWGLLMCSFLHGGDSNSEPLAAWLVIAGLMFAAARWSVTWARESPVALVLLDAPVIFTLRDQLPVPSAVLLTLVLIGGVVTLSRTLTAVLVVELIAIHTQLPGGLTGAEAGTARGLSLAALGAWIVWRSTRRESP
jgi:hypothetical protein